MFINMIDRNILEGTDGNNKKARTSLKISKSGKQRQEQQEKYRHHGVDPQRKRGEGHSKVDELRTIGPQGTISQRTFSMSHDLVQILNQARNVCGRIVNNNVVQFVVVLLIAINAIMMGIGTFKFVVDDPGLSELFDFIDLIFLWIFTVELFLHFVYHGWKLICDAWLVFDLIIIVTSWSFAQVHIMRAFRIFRALRLITRIKTMKNLIIALGDVMPRLAAIGLMLGLIYYIFAVMFTQLFKDLYKNGLTDYDYFSRLDGTFFSLFQITTLDAWGDIARDVMETHKFAWLPFVTFVVISSFIVVNLIIAVICDSISSLHHREKAKIYGRFFADDDNSNYDSEDDDDIISNCNNASKKANFDAASTLPKKEEADSTSIISMSTTLISSEKELNHQQQQKQQKQQQEFEIRELVNSLELKMDELTMVQTQTINALQLLTMQLKVQHNKTRTSKAEQKL